MQLADWCKIHFLRCSYCGALKGPAGKYVNGNFFTGWISSQTGESDIISFAAASARNEVHLSVNDFDVAEALSFEGSDSYILTNQVSYRKEKKADDNKNQN